MNIRIFSIGLFLILLFGWEFFCQVSGISPLVVPAPTAVFETLWFGLINGNLLPHIWITTTEMVLGLGIGCCVGFL